MIALPLVWDESGRYTACGRYKVNVMRGRVTKYVWLAYGFISEKVEDIDAAQAACERHHQVAYVRGLSKEARSALSDYTIWHHGGIVSPATWLAILDEADAADRSEQEAKP